MSKNKSDLSDRMKEYEKSSQLSFPPRTPVLIRVDGRAFRTFTKIHCEKPYDHNFIRAMQETMLYMMEELQTCVFAYHQSDEISFLLHSYKTYETQPWFDNRRDKITTMAASAASNGFNFNFFMQYTLWEKFKERVKSPRSLAKFDARAWTMPEQDVENYFIWRQKDATRNSIAMLAQSLYSTEQLKGKKREDQLQMCLEKKQDWLALPAHIRQGSVCYKNAEGDFVVEAADYFTKEREFFKQLLEVTPQ